MPVAPVSQLTSPPYHHFFGYYDKSPWSRSGKYILTLESSFMSRPPNQEDQAHILVKEVNAKNWEKIAQTNTWNWQEGARLQWLKRKDAHVILYNTRIDQQFVSVEQNIISGKKINYCLPIYDVNSDGTHALSLNFARLHNTRPGYGYPSISTTKADLAPDDDGIYLLDLASNTYSLKISLADLYHENWIPNMDKGKHWVQHLTFNPSGTRFSFLHRWQRIDKLWFSRLYTANIDGSQLWCLCDDDLISHFAWRDDLHLTVWTRNSRNEGAYRLFSDRQRDSELVGLGKLLEDGHCSYSPNRKWLLTDTYPDSSYNQRLFLFALDIQKKIEIGRFAAHSALAHYEIRCDLHPRWHPNGDVICIDSAHDGTRQMYQIDVSNYVLE